MTLSGRWLPRLIGPAILAYFLFTTDLSRIALNLSGVRWGPLVASLALYPLVAVPKAWRWALLIRSLGMTAPTFASALRLYMIGLFLGGATPGQSGDFLKAWYLRDRGQPLGPAVFSVLLDRLFDLMLMAVMSVVGVVVLLRFFPPERQGSIEFAAGMTAVAAALAVPALMARRSREWLMGVVAARAPARIGAALDRWRAQLGALELRSGVAGAVLAATVVAAGVSIARLWLLFSALTISIPLIALIATVALISVLQALPISFAGVGVRDAVLVAVLGAYGFRTDQALALSALFLLLNLENIVVGFAVSLRSRSAIDAMVHEKA
jgi:uncharacterized protein (TIRG00374 family)